MESVKDVTRFPLLDSLHWEILRMYPAPAFFFKVSAPLVALSSLRLTPSLFPISLAVTGGRAPPPTMLA